MQTGTEKRRGADGADMSPAAVIVHTVPLRRSRRPFSFVVVNCTAVAIVSIHSFTPNIFVVYVQSTDGFTHTVQRLSWRSRSSNRG